MHKWKALWQWTEKYLLLFGYLELRTSHGMKDVQQVEVAPTSSGDVPKNANDIVAALPDVPENVEIKSLELNTEDKVPIVMDLTSDKIDEKK